MDISGIIAIIAPFLTAITIVGLVTNGPKARAKAEIMKRQALAQIEDKRGLINAVANEELGLAVSDQQKRLEGLEEEVRFLRKLLEDRSRP